MTFSMEKIKNYQRSKLTRKTFRFKNLYKLFRKDSISVKTFKLPVVEKFTIYGR